MTRRIRVDIYPANDPSATEPLWTLHEQTAADWEPGKVANLLARRPDGARCGMSVHHSPCPNPPIGRWFTIDGPILLCAECYRDMDVEDDRALDRGAWVPLQA